MGGNVKPGSGLLVVLRRKTANGQNVTSSFTTLFSVNDHLGSTRAVMDAAGNILERNAYYPFGLQTDPGNGFPNMSSILTALYPRYINPSATRRDLYNGKEIQSIAGTDYLDYGFRQYDPVTARWMAVDPKTDNYLSWTPYNYCVYKPICKVDVDGCQDDYPDKDKNNRIIVSKTISFKRERSILPSQPFIVATSSTIIESGKKEDINIDLRAIKTRYPDKQEKRSVAGELQFSGLLTSRIGIESNSIDKKQTTPIVYGSFGISNKIDDNFITEIRVISIIDSDKKNCSLSLNVSYRYKNVVKEYSFGLKPIGMATVAATTALVLINNRFKLPIIPQLIKSSPRVSPTLVKTNLE